VKRSGRDESVRVVIHFCMEAMLGISLYSYTYLNWQKFYFLLIIAYVFSSTKLEKRAEQVLPRSEWGGQEKKTARGKGVKWPKQCMHI
jgi:hypothetical protein